MLNASACKNLPACEFSWKRSCEDKKMTTCKDITMDLKQECKTEGSACVMLGTEMVCTEVSEQSTLLNDLCEEEGITEKCKKTDKRKVCTKEEPEMCVEVEEQAERKCTKRGNTKWCITEGKSAKMGTEEVCTDFPQQWQKCKVDEDARKACMKKCFPYSRFSKYRKQCEHECTMSAEQCWDTQEHIVLANIKVLFLRFGEPFLVPPHFPRLRTCSMFSIFYTKK